MWIDDDILMQMTKELIVDCWVPDRAYVVLGAANDPKVEVHEERCREDSVTMLRRYGGGGSVVLHEGCLILSLGTWVKNPYGNSEYFRMINSSVIECLQSYHSIFNNLSLQGISDICYFEKKIAGTSMFRSKHYLLYQASVLINPRIEVIERYLNHPSKEPEYRQFRKHADFLIGISDILSTQCSSDSIDPLSLKLFFENNWETLCKRTLDQHLLGPQENEFPALLARIERAKTQSNCKRGN